MSPAPLTSSLAKQIKAHTDVVGLELGSGLSQGTPAVRLRKRDGKVELVAAGFLDLPGTLPTDKAVMPEENNPSWTLPRPFRAPYAALAINSKQAFLRHSTGFVEEASEKKVTYRQASRQVAPDVPPFIVGLPEAQAAWAARLLPEGCRPTACSLQVAAAAAMGGWAASPSFSEAAGNAVALFVYEELTVLGAFQDGNLVLCREHPVGLSHLRSAICAHMRIDLSLADAVLGDTLIDPAPAIEPVLRPLFRQVEISADYLSRRRKSPVEHFFVCGITVGSPYWVKFFARIMNHALIVCSPLDGIDATATPAACRPHDLQAAAPFLMSAAGAARTVLEDV